MKNKKIRVLGLWSGIAAVLVGLLLLGADKVRATWPDEEADLGVLNIRYLGNRVFKVGAQGGANFDIQDNNTTGAVGLRVSGTDGSVSFRGRTSAQLSLLAPAAANEMIMNTSRPALCISTGTGAGAWVGVASGSATIANQSYALAQCY